MISVNFRRLVCLFVMCLLVLWAAPSRAQQATGSILGTVTDPSGGAIPNAKVTVKNLGTNNSRSMQTGSAGDYAFSDLDVGAYSVTVEAGGFKTFSAPSLTIATGDHARIDAQMQVGSAGETVEVSAVAAPVLQTDSSTVGGLVTSEAVQDLPVNGRNFIRLVQLAPGASEGPQSSLSGGTRPDDRRQTSTVVANGQTDASNNYLLDGMDNNERAIATIIVKPSIDALQEVKVDTNLFSADTGRNGGAVITMITRSGSNKFHGTAFEFLRNDIFDARDAFDTTGRKPEYRQNQYGGSIGGPIQKDKTFFFLDYEGLRIIQGQTQTAEIPTPCELTGTGCPVPSTTGGLTAGLAGNFSDTIPVGHNCATAPIAGCIYQANGTPFPFNIIPTATTSSVAENYAKLEPIVTGCTASPCTFIGNQNKTQFFHTADARIDHHFGDRDTLFGRYTINNGDSSFPGALPGVNFPGVGLVYGDAAAPIFGSFPGQNYGRQQNLTLGWSHIFQPNLLLDLHASYSRYVSISTANNAAHDVNKAFGGPANVNLDTSSSSPFIPGTGGLALVSFQNGGLSALGDQFALPTDYWDTNFQYTGALIWTRGAHTFKFGGSLLRRDWSTYQQLFKGWFQFGAAQTAGSIGASTGIGGNSFASLITGNTAFGLQVLSFGAPQDRDWEVGEYAQDDWRVNHWLTLNLGLRYDIFTPFSEKHGQISNFDPTNPGILAGGRVIVANQNNVSSTLNLTAQKNMFQPRIGFAASLHHGFVLRGGFGTVYYVSNSASPANLRNAPFASTGLAFGTAGFAGFPTPSEQPSTECLIAACGGSPGNSVGSGFATNFQNAMLYMSNVTLEKAFGPNDLSIGWVGEPGRHLARDLPNIDLPGPPGVTGCTNVSEPGPCQPYFPQLPLTSQISLLESNGYSSYNAMNVIFTRRYSAGLTVGANYTWAHALSNTAGANACNVCGILPNNLRYDYGNSNFDVRNRIAITVNYELPFGKSMTGIEGQLVKGWQVNGIYSFAAGIPFSVADSLNLMGVGLPNGGPDRPNMTALTPFTKSLNEWFNVADFTAQPAGFPGNEEVNQLSSPASKRMDLSLFKDFAVRESVTLQFRTEVFNLSNTPNYATPNATISAFTSNATGSPATSAGDFGAAQSTSPLYTPREIQFALKLLF